MHRKQELYQCAILLRCQVPSFLNVTIKLQKSRTHKTMKSASMGLASVVLVSLVGKVSDCMYESFQLAILIVCVQVQPAAECVRITHSMRVRITQGTLSPNVGCNKPFDPRESR